MKHLLRALSIIIALLLPALLYAEASDASGVAIRPTGRIATPMSAGDKAIFSRGMEAVSSINAAEPCYTQTFAGAPVYEWPVPQGLTTAYAMRFTPLAADTLKEVEICIWDPGDGSFGDDTVKVRLYADDGFGLPGTVLVTKNVPPGSYVKYPDTTQVDFSAFNLVFSSDFHVGVSTSATANYETILSDSGTTGTARSSYFYQGQWYPFPRGGDEDYNFHIWVTLCVPQPSPCVSPPVNIVAWLPFDETSGPIAMNMAGGNNGKHVNGPSVVSGKVGNALCFDGVDDYVAVKSYAAINMGAKDFSFDAWIRRSSSASTTQTILDKRAPDGLGGTRGYTVFLLNGTLWLQLYDGASWNNYNSSLPVPADGNWHFVAISVKRTPGQIFFYVDGSAAGPISHTHTNSLSSSEELRIGARSASQGGGVCFYGCIDELELYPRALTSAELAAIRDAAEFGKCKRLCYLPQRTPFCLNNNTKTITARICNMNVVPKTYNYAFSWIGGPGCSGLGNTPFSPASGSVSVPAAKCASLNVVVTKPTWLTTVGQTACFRMICTDAATAEVCVCFGSVIGTFSICPEPSAGGFDMLVDSTVSVGPINFTNTGAATDTVNFRFSVRWDLTIDDTCIVELNGLPQGTPVTGTLVLGPGQSTGVPLTARYREYDPLEFSAIQVEFDLDGGKSLDTVACIMLRNYIPATETTYVCGDASGDGSVDISDAVYLIAYIFAGGPAPDPLLAGDANCDQTVDISDAVYLIQYIFGGGPAPCDSSGDGVPDC